MSEELLTQLAVSVRELFSRVGYLETLEDCCVSIYGEIYYHKAGFDIVMAAQDTWYQFLGFDTVGENHLTTVSTANNDITIQRAGVYLVSLDIAVFSANAIDWDIGVWKNNGTVQAVNGNVLLTTIAGGKALAAGLTFLVALDVGDTLEVWAERLSGGAAAKTLTFQHCTLNCVMVDES